MAEADDRPLLSLDPPLYADDFLPALWVPLTRAVRARRRLLTLGERLPARSWQEPSAAPGWNRRDQLAHVAASDWRYHDALTAAMNDRPLTEFEPHPDQPGPSSHWRTVWRSRPSRISAWPIWSSVCAPGASGRSSYWRRSTRTTC